MKFIRYINGLCGVPTARECCDPQMNYRARTG
jgi:hypothetical protein